MFTLHACVLTLHTPLPNHSVVTTVVKKSQIVIMWDKILKTENSPGEIELDGKFRQNS